MLSVFKLANAVNEAANGSYSSFASVAPYSFIGTMDEATVEFNTQVMSEAAEIMEFRAGAEEIMAEAAASNPGAMAVLVENVFQSIKEHMSKFFKKLIAVIKGIIEKLKAFFFRLTGKTDKWLTIMKPKIETAAKEPGYSDQTAEMHKWNIEYVTSGIKDAMVKMTEINDYKTVFDSHKRLPSIERYNTIKADVKALSADHSGADTDSPAVKEEVEFLEQMAEQYKGAADKVKNEAPKAFASALGVSANSSMDAVWQDVAKKANGGEKTTVKFASEYGLTKMMDAIAATKKTIKDLEDFYNKRLKTVTEYAKKYDDTMNAAAKFDEKANVPAAITTAYKNCVTVESSGVMAAFNILETALNTARGANVRYVQDMSSEFMSVLTKFANYKAPKK